MNVKLDSRRQSQDFRSSQQGYVLVETMISLIIAAIGIAGLGNATQHASKVGVSAHQTTLVTIAQRSILSQLRLYSEADASATQAYRFSTHPSNSSSSPSALDHAILNQSELLAPSFSDIYSTVDCLHNAVTTCEVCFHWQDVTRALSGNNLEQQAAGATNRSSCQFQIV